MSASDGIDVHEGKVWKPDGAGAPATTAGPNAEDRAAQTQGTLDRQDAAKMAEATAALMEAATKALQKSSEFLEKSSRWTLLFCAVLFGLALAVAPLILIWGKGDLAATAPEYLATSLIGGMIALVGLVGLIVSERGALTAVAAVQETSGDVVAALRERNRTTYGSQEQAKPQ